MVEYAKNGRLREVEILLKWDLIDVNLGDANGTAALHAASEEGHDDVVRVLVQRSVLD